MTLRRPSRWLRAPRIVLPAILGFALLVATVFGAGSAHAQSIAIVNEASLPRLDARGNAVTKRQDQLTREAVSLQDCVDNQSIRFTLQLAGFAPNASIQAWAANTGTCDAETARAGGVQTCWRIFDANIPLQQTIDVDVPVRRIMSGVPPFSASKTDTTANACGKVDLATISVQFLYFAPGNLSQAATNKTIAVTVDTVGPAAPTGLSVLPGNTRLQVKWINVSGGSPDAGTGGGVTELTGVNVYCDTATPGASTTKTEVVAPVCTEVPNNAGDAGVVSDAGPTGTTTVCTDAGTRTVTVPTPACGSSNFTPADGSAIYPTAEFNAKYLCGSVAGNTAGVDATGIGDTPLVNGTKYAVAVAATDKFGNVGPLSAVQCEMPELTTDFWEDYQKAGGKAGGGCEAASDVPFSSLSTLGVLVALTASFVRRRRNRR